MFAEDLLQDLRRDGFAPAAVATYIRRIGSRVVQRLPHHPGLVRSVAATALVLFAIQFAAALLFSLGIDRRFGVEYLLASSAVLLVSAFWVLTHLGLVSAAGATEGMPPLRHVPVPVADVIMSALSKNPEARPPDARAFAHAGRLADGRTTQPFPDALQAFASAATGSVLEPAKSATATQYEAAVVELRALERRVTQYCANGLSAPLGSCGSLGKRASSPPTNALLSPKLG